MRAVLRILGTHSDGDIAFIAHGGVGTLLLCKLLDAPIRAVGINPSKDISSRSTCRANKIIDEWRPIAER